MAAAKYKGKHTIISNGILSHYERIKTVEDLAEFFSGADKDDLQFSECIDPESHQRFVAVTNVKTGERKAYDFAIARAYKNEVEFLLTLN